MPFVAKRVKAAQSKVTAGKHYPVDEALKLVKELATAKFNEGIDAAVRTIAGSARSMGVDVEGV